MMRSRLEETLGDLDDELEKLKLTSNGGVPLKAHDFELTFKT